MAYTYEQVFAADPANPANIAQNAAITIFAPGDVTMTPLSITDPDGTPLPNPIPVNANGFGSAFAHATLDRVAWAGGGFTGFFTSYEGMKQVAVDAQAAAESAAATAGADAAAVAEAAIAGATDEATAAAASAATAATNAASSATAAANAAALVGAPADTAIAAAVNNGASATKAALNATFVPKWKAATAYLAGDKVVSPAGDVVSAKVDFTSGASFSAANWNYTSNVTVINAKAPQYGVKGDGATDDTAAIQALLDSVGPNTTIQFPAGTYLHDHLVFTGKSNFALVGDGAVFVATTRTERYLSFVNCTDFTVRGITSKGATATVRSGPTRGISLEGCGRFLIQGNHVYNTEGVGILAGVGCYDGRIASNLVHDTMADGIHITGVSKRMAVTGNVLRDTGDDAIAVVSYGTDTAQCENVSISGNTTYHSQSRGIAVVGGKNVTISGNTIDSPRNAGVYASYESTYGTRIVEDITISGNTIIGANTYGYVTDYAGIHVIGSGGTTTPVRGVTITGNTVEGSRVWGLLLGASGAGVYSVNVSGNTFRNGLAQGVLVQAAKDVIFSGNLIDTSGESGLQFVGTLGTLSVTNNVVLEPNRTSVAATRRGIWIGSPGVTRATVAGNTVVDSTSASTALFDYSTAANVLAFGNNFNGNPINFPSASGQPFVVPSNALLAGALPTSGTGGGVGIVGIRNATTAPSTNPSSGGILYASGGTPFWRTSGGSTLQLGGDVQVPTVNYTLLATDRTALAYGGASGITITLPAPVNGARYEIKKVDNTAGAVTVNTTAGKLIDGAATKTLAYNEAIRVVSNGIDWFIV
jgi:polygalacturonase